MIVINKKLNVVITAGASGIGRTIARLFLEQGCSVFVCDISEEFILDFGLEFPGVFTQKADVSNYLEVRDFFKNIKKEVGYIDVLINGAGIAGPTDLLEDVEPEAWDRTIRVNVNGMFYCVKEAIPMLKKSSTSSIINIASTASFFGFPYRSPYTSAKWATIGMTKTLAMELGEFGIRVNAICPGSVVGDRIDRVIEADAKKQGKAIEEIKAIYLRQVSMKTFVEPEDVAHLAIFLCSAEGRYISGQAIGLDGHTEGLSNTI
jgi:NAD(P)-dependent dehydrogenase (short-subunit alcohol dehydrogenase family)